jgi:hypothetical protein
MRIGLTRRITIHRRFTCTLHCKDIIRFLIFRLISRFLCNARSYLRFKPLIQKTTLRLLFAVDERWKVFLNTSWLKIKRDANLARLIELAKEQTDLAAPLTSLSHAIRSGGNLGAHFDMEKEPNEGLALQMVELLEYLIRYLYVLPKEIKKLEQNLERGA